MIRPKLAIELPPLRYPFAPGPFGRPPPVLTWARAHRPVCPVLLPSGHTVWMVTRKDDIGRVLTDSRFSRNLVYDGAPRLLDADLTSLPGGIFNLDPPDHTRVRSVLTPYFSRRRIGQYRAAVEGHAAALLDAMAAEGTAADLVAAYTAPLAMLTSCDILGIPPGLHAEYRSAFSTENDLTADAATVAQATHRLLELARRVVAWQRRAPAGDDNPVRALIRAHENGALSRDELHGTVVFLLFTGGDAVVSPLGAGIFTLLRHPAQLRQCGERPELWARAVEEVLRYHHNGVLGQPRVATEDVQLHGLTIRRGQGVCAAMLGATWDPEHYRDPAVFDIHRSTDGSATFGAGRHYCLGAALARLILHTAYATLFRRLPTLSLAIPEEDVPWDQESTFTMPSALPVRW
ncbi:cytochrome P450 [Streptomyces albireticuli]|uniref:cytochrome P450 n=1 Tax=Streptomyces albireticuli TaxID=1940 RepID=UPI003676DB90